MSAAQHEPDSPRGTRAQAAELRRGVGRKARRGEARAILIAQMCGPRVEVGLHPNGCKVLSGEAFTTGVCVRVCVCVRACVCVLARASTADQNSRFSSQKFLAKCFRNSS